MENTLKLYRPFKHFIVNQAWGNPNPAYNQFGFTRHNGLDCSSAYSDQYTNYAPKTWPVYCPVEGFTVQLVRYMPNGGGHEIWMMSDKPLQLGDKLCHAYLVMCHAEKIFLKPGNKPVLGELMMIADNTGFSTGPHTHIGLYRVNWDGKKITYLDQNDANGSHDPALYLSSEYAVDKATLVTLVKSNMRYYQYQLTK